ncbi:MAG: hypothetical protein ETSY2_35730, partial [Candidatus Entotheonella gemina]
MRTIYLLGLCLCLGMAFQVDAADPVNPAEEIRRFDTNGDGNFDQWEIRVNGQLTRLEADLNHDTRVDYWLTYEQGKPRQAEFDTNGNGQVDQREIYNAQGGIQAVRTDRDGDGLLEQHVVYGPKQSVLRIETDENGDAKI